MNALPQIGLRAGFVAIALLLWFWTQRLISGKAPAGNGVGDRLHDWSAPLHDWLAANPRAANLTLIITSALIDLFGLYLLGSAVLGPTLRPFVAILILFALRQGCQAVCTLPTPPGAIWRHPGFPSLLVTYGTSNDFFFSGHTAISVLGAIELAHGAPGWLAGLGVLVAMSEAATVIVLRAHYTMDVFAAVFAAWGADILAHHIAPIFDLWLGRLG
ncbi:MAG TPA: phosphatase PAP2-related protein [Opitutaceae bacterium]|nr:phosphatase PAP2-related protein [Opitutaceae bacterium]